MNTVRLKLIAVFLLSAVIIGYELSVMRSFAVGSWATFGSMVISIALLGFGLAGTVLTFLKKKLEKNADLWLTICAIAMPVVMAVGHILAQQVPFNPKFIANDPSQLWLIALFFLIYSLPFLCGAFFIGIAFIVFSSHIHKLYFWNMAGSGIGGFLILGCMYIFPPDYLSVPLFILAGIGSLLLLLPKKEGFDTVKQRRILFGSAGAALVLSIVLIVFFGTIRISPEKSISIFRTFPGYKEVYHSYSPLGEIDVIESSLLHSAPGLSDNFEGNENMTRKMPENAFMGLFVDGSGPMFFMRKLEGAENEFLDFLPMAAAYQIKENPETLLIHAGGGLSAFSALHGNSAHVTIAEQNSDMLYLLGEEEIITRFNHNLLSDPKITVKREEPRAYSASTSDRFDLVEISLIDSVGLNDSGGYAVQENFTYTVEGMSDFMHALKPGGVLSITVWNKLLPPRNVLRLLTTTFNSLKYQGVEHPESRIFVFDDLLKTATVLVKHGSDFTSGEIAQLKQFCESRWFEISYYPGIPVREKNFEAILDTYHRELYTSQESMSNEVAKELQNQEHGLLGLLATASSEKEIKEETLIPSDLYHFTIQWMSSGRESELYDRYIFDIRPATDDRPYYTGYMKPESLSILASQIHKLASEWGFILLLGTLVQSVIFGLCIILIPLFGRRKELFNRQKGTAGIIVYYACLGLGFMLIEIFLIQKLVFFLSDPLLSTSIVISSMLVISGIGSLLSSRIAKDRTKRIRIAAAGIAASVLFYMFALSPLLSGMLGLPFIVKVFITIVFIAPSAFFLGMPFPTGLDALQEKRPGIIPWAWGMNGALSVTGVAIARIMSVSFGFFWVLGAGILLYIIVGIIFPVNENGNKKELIAD